MMGLGLNAEWTVGWGVAWYMANGDRIQNNKDDERESERAAAAACAGDLSGDLVRSPIYQAAVRKGQPHGKQSEMQLKHPFSLFQARSSTWKLPAREYTRACLSSTTLSSALGYGYGSDRSSPC